MTSPRVSTRFATYAAWVSATLMIAHQVGGKATRDAIFLTHFDVTQLPKMVIVAALLSMLAVIFMSRLLARFGPSRVVPTAFFASALLFIGSWLLYADAPRLAAITLYLQMAVFGAVLISGFWSVVNERFDPHTAKRTIAQVAAAATLGGVIGGVLAGQVAAMIDARAMMVVLGILHLASAATVFAIGAPRGHGARETLVVDSGIQLLFQHRYLLAMGLLMVSIASLAALVDYAFKVEASRRFDDEAALVSFFGRFYAIAGVVTFFVQSVLGPRVLNRFGIGATLSIMPALVLVLGLLNTAVLRLWTIVALRGCQMVLQNSFFRSAFELLYTPLPPHIKRPTKSIIDVASDRLGDIVGGGVVLLLLALIEDLPPGFVIAAAVVAALIALVIISHLYRGYVEQLASNLRDGSISINNEDIVDATTRHTFAEASSASERSLLLERIENLKAQRGASGDAWHAHPDSMAPPSGEEQRLAQAIADLNSGDLARVERCLHGEFMDTRLAPFIVPMLAVDELSELARTELRWMAPTCVGALNDALLDPDLPLLARQRLPSVLEVSHHPRAVQALLSGLEETEFNVRYSAGRALSRMHERDEQLPIDTQAIFRVCASELAVTEEQWQAHDIRHDDLGGADLIMSSNDSEDIDYGLEHVFNLLGLVLDRDALHLSLRAVFSPDRGIRGTALEYLENVLPDQIRQDLWRHLGISNGTGQSPSRR